MPNTAASKKPLVSAIVNFFNEEKFLQEAIESIFAQTYDNWELLLADDGSTDASPEIALRYAESYPEKVRYLDHPHHHNRGASAARNLGIHKANGDYIALLDADDVWLPNKLERQVDIMESQRQAGMLCGATEWWFSWTESAADVNRDYTVNLGVAPGSLLTPPSLLTMFLNGQARVPCTSSILLRREVINVTGGFEESFRRLYTDQSFYAKVCLKTPVLVSGESWSKYRQHPASSCTIAAKTGEHDAARLFYLDWLKRYLSSHRIQDRGLSRALKRKQWRHRHPKLHSALSKVRKFL